VGRRSSNIENLPQYVSGFTDRHGKRRYKFRRAGVNVSLKEHPGTPKHPSAEYKALLAGLRPANDAPRAKPGSISDLIQRYYGTTSFTNPSPVTREKVRAILEDFRSKHGTKPAALVQFNHIEAILAEKAKPTINAAKKRVGGPNAAKSLEKHLRRVFDYALKLASAGVPGFAGMQVNPVTLAEGVKVPKTGGFHTWTEEEIQQYRDHYPLGTKGRLAIEIILWTLQRRGDTSRFGPKDRKGGMIHVWNEKTKKMTWVPEPSQLTEAIEAMPAVGLTSFLVTEFGKPFTPAGFGNWFRDRCNEAGLPHCSAHGLRKATGRRLAEFGATQQQIKAAGNWVGDKEVATYTADANQKRLATEAMTGLAEWELSNHGSGVRQSGGGDA
jgi:integrase